MDRDVQTHDALSSTCLVSVARNRYSVPCGLHGQMVSTRLYPAGVAIVAGDSIVARHDRLSNAGETHLATTIGVSGITRHGKRGERPVRPS